jgi:hypothetical protein
MKILTNDEADYKLVAEALKITGGAVFPFAYDQITLHNVAIISEFEVIGTVNWGGNPRHKFLVGVYLKGIFHFDPHQTFDGDYFAEKLGMQLVDAAPLAEFFNGVAKAYLADDK